MSVLAFTWSGFAQQIVSGLSTGGIYASLALALVIIYRSTRVINFAQGEMATFSTFIAWELINQGLSKWVAFFATDGLDHLHHVGGQVQMGDLDAGRDARRTRRVLQNARRVAQRHHDIAGLGIDHRDVGRERLKRAAQFRQDVPKARRQMR